MLTSSVVSSTRQGEVRQDSRTCQMSGACVHGRAVFQARGPRPKDWPCDERKKEKSEDVKHDDGLRSVVSSPSHIPRVKAKGTGCPHNRYDTHGPPPKASTRRPKQLGVEGQRRWKRCRTDRVIDRTEIDRMTVQDTLTEMPTEDPALADHWAGFTDPDVDQNHATEDG